MFDHLNTRIPKRIEQEKEKVSVVLIPLIKKDGKYHILFEIRSNNLSHQPGEICFPGGKRESLETSLQTAVRETCEELLVSESDIQVYGSLDYFLSPTGISIDEVSDIFMVPLEFFQNTLPKRYYNNVQMQPEHDFPFDKIPGGRNYPWAKGKYEVLFYEYENHIIWGITAKILFHNIKLIQ